MLSLFKGLFNWMTRSIGKNFSIVTIVLVLTAACSYLGIKAEDIYNWYEGDTTKLVVILLGLIFLAGLVGFGVIEHNINHIKEVVDDSKEVLTSVDSLEKEIHKDASSIDDKIATIIRQIGDSSAAIVLLVQMTIQAVPQNIYLAVEPYLELSKLSNLQKQSLVEKLEEVKKSLFIEVSYFIKRFYGEKLRTVIVNEPIKIAMRDAFKICYKEVDEVLNKEGYTASDKLAEINRISYVLVRKLFRAILNEEYDIAKAKNMEGAASIAKSD